MSFGLKMGVSLGSGLPWTPWRKVPGCVMATLADRRTTLAGGKVAQWSDPFGNVFTTASADNYPTPSTLSTGAPAIYFDPATQDVLTCAITVAQPCTIYSVQEWDGLTGYGGWGGLNGNELTHIQYDAAHVYQSDGAHQLVAAAPSVGPSVFCYVANGASSEMYNGGTLIASGDVGTNGLTSVTLGQSQIVIYTAGRKFAAFFIFTGAHDDNARTRTTSWLSAWAAIG